MVSLLIEKGNPEKERVRRQDCYREFPEGERGSKRDGGTWLRRGAAEPDCRLGRYRLRLLQREGAVLVPAEVRAVRRG